MGRMTKGTIMGTLNLAGVAIAAALTGCGPQGDSSQTVTGTAEMVNKSSQALSVGALQWMNGTYGANCKVNANGNWSLAIAGGVGAMDYTALSVVKNDSSCTLTLTQLVTNENTKTTYSHVPGSSDIALGGSYGTATKYGVNGATPILFYANADMSPSDFSADFTVNIVYSDNPSDLTGSVTGSYSTVTASANSSSVTAPDYTLDLSGVSLTVDASYNFVSTSGNATLTYHSVAGTGYYIDTSDALGASPTFSAIDAAYAANAGSATAISNNNNQSVAATAFSLSGSLSSTVYKSIVIQRVSNGVKAYEVFRIAFSHP